MRQFEKVPPVLCGDIMNLAIVARLGYLETKLIQFILQTISLYFQVLKAQRFIHSLILCRISLGWGERFYYIKEVQVNGSSFRRRAEKKDTNKATKIQISFFSSIQVSSRLAALDAGCDESFVSCNYGHLDCRKKSSKFISGLTQDKYQAKIFYFTIPNVKLHVKGKRKQRKKLKKIKRGSGGGGRQY